MVQVLNRCKPELNLPDPVHSGSVQVQVWFSFEMDGSVWGSGNLGPNRTKPNFGYPRRELIMMIRGGKFCDKVPYMGAP